MNIRETPRDSFDRFGDDLCEFVLSKLDLVSKTRFECVSKQWRRTILVKHKKVIIGVDVFHTSEDAIDYWICGSGRNSIRKKVIDSDNFAGLLNKCRSLDTIEFSETVSIRFGTDKGSIKEAFRLMPNLKRVDSLNNYFEDFLFSDSSKLVYLKKLTEFWPLILLNSEFAAFADLYSGQIEKLNVRLEYGNDVENATILDCFRQLSRFERLKTLRIDLWHNWRSAVISEALELIGCKCGSLTELTLLNCNGLLTGNSFTGFGHLERLNISHNNFRVVNCPTLTSLYLIDVSFDDVSAQSIGNSLPQLVSLKLDMGMSETLVTDLAFHGFAKMTRLQTLSVKSSSRNYFAGVTDLGVCHLIDKCPELLNLGLYLKANISKVSLDSFAKRAKFKPKIHHKFWCSDIYISDEYKLLSYDVKSDEFRSLLPNNLIVQCFEKFKYL